MKNKVNKNNNLNKINNNNNKFLNNKKIQLKQQNQIIKKMKIN